MNLIHLSILIFVNISILFLGILVYLNNKKSSTNRAFIIVAIGIILWVTTLYLSDQSTFYNYALFINRLIFSVAFINGASLLYFAFVFPNNLPVFSRPLRLFFFLLTGILALLSVSTNFIVKGIEIRDWGTNIDLGHFYFIFIFWMISCVIGMLISLIKKYINFKDLKKIQLQYLFLGFLLSAIITITTNIVSPLVTGSYAFAKFGPYSMIFLVTFTAYAITRHHLMDIRLLVVKSIVYFLLFLFITFIYTFFVVIIGVLLFKQDLQASTFWPPLAVALVVGFTLHPLRRAFTKWTDRIFFKDRYDFEDLTKKLNEVATSTIILSELLFRFLNNLLEEMRITRGTFILLENGKIYETESVGYKEVINLEPDEIKHLIKEGKTEIFDEVLEGSKCKEIMRKYNASLIFPLKTEGEIVGFLILGEKKSGDIYTAQDIRVLEIITAQLALGVQNAKAYEKTQKFNLILRAEVNRATKELRDVNERLREADKAKDEFISMASHEIRTPIATLEGYLSILNSQKLKAEAAQEISKRSYESVDRLSTLVKDLLDVSRIDQKRIQISKQPIRLERIIDHVIESFELRARDKGIYLKFKKPEKMLPEINIDADRIEEVLNNLVGNAIKFTDKGGITISIDKKGNNAIVAVADTGQGIPKDALPNLFKKFYQAQTASSVLSNEKGGTGLGLYITKNILEMHGGKIWAESIWRKGATFYFSLPMK